MTTVLFKTLLFSLLALALVALGLGFYYLMHDAGKGQRVANVLLVRVTLCAILLALLVYGYSAGYIQFTSPIGLVK